MQPTSNMKPNLEEEGLKAGQKFATDYRGTPVLRCLKTWRWAFGRPDTIEELAERMTSANRDDTNELEAQELEEQIAARADPERKSEWIERILTRRYSAVGQREWITGFLKGVQAQGIPGQNSLTYRRGLEEQA
jgi:hypothetical protein